MGRKTLDDMALSGKRVLVRVDINVPMENGRVTDASRIERIAPTIAHIFARPALNWCLRSLTRGLPAWQSD